MASKDTLGSDLGQYEPTRTERLPREGLMAVKVQARGRYSSLSHRLHTDIKGPGERWGNGTSPLGRWKSRTQGGVIIFAHCSWRRLRNRVKQKSSGEEAEA